MDLEKLKERYKKFLKNINLENLYEQSIKNADMAQKISKNSNIFNDALIEYIYLFALICKVDMDLLIDEEKLEELTGTSQYNSSIQSCMFYINKPDYKEFLSEDEQTIVEIYKDVETINELEKISKEVSLTNTEVINDEIVNRIVNNEAPDQASSTNELEKAIISLSKIFNINNRYSFFLIENNSYIDNIIKNINMNEANKPKINKIYAQIKKYALERL